MFFFFFFLNFTLSSNTHGDVCQTGTEGLGWDFNAVDLNVIYWGGPMPASGCAVKLLRVLLGTPSGFILTLHAIVHHTHYASRHRRKIHSFLVFVCCGWLVRCPVQRQRGSQSPGTQTGPGLGGGAVTCHYWSGECSAPDICQMDGGVPGKIFITKTVRHYLCTVQVYGVFLYISVEFTNEI